ncbi:MAG: hypothetical protein ACR2IN_07990 [Thermoleophilaceae bacterium]
MRDGRLEVPGVQGAGYDLDVDLEDRKVTVIVSEPESETEEWFVDRYGDDVCVEAGEIAVPDLAPE